MISIDRLENLSTKGKDRSAYYTIIKISILPSEKYIKCTKVLQNCSSPEVKEDFNFSVKELSGRVLRLSVFDASLQKQHEAVGHALLTMNDIICNQPKKYCIKLFRRTRVCAALLCDFLIACHMLSLIFTLFVLFYFSALYFSWDYSFVFKIL